MTSASVMGTLAAELVRIVLGSSCVVCDEELPLRRRVGSCCVECWSNLPRLVETTCATCALPMPGLESSASLTCLRCQTEPLATDWIDSWGRYDSGLTKVLQAFKFRRHEFLAEPLADLLESVCRARSDIDFDVVIPVPMSRKRERQRGFNQSELLAKGLARRLEVRHEMALLRKTADGRRQSELKQEERKANVKGTFEASPSVAGLRILLVDDICTTGATLSECARALLRKGATAAAAITVARTP